jgi:sugar O-acyltransferase (sialic acid O-acetyltransferase NeuD family)
MTKICLAGYSGHGYVVAEIVNLLQYTLIGYFDIEENKDNPFGLQYLGDENKINTDFFISEDVHIALGIGNNITRGKIYEFFKKKDVSFKVLQHPAAVVSSLSLIAEGTVIMASAVINPFVKIGKAAICNSGSIIEHECSIADFVHIAPGAVLAGNVTVGESSFIGANAFIKQGLTIGKNVTIGAGSVVINDVPDNTVIYGNPAKNRNS